MKQKRKVSARSLDAEQNQIEEIVESKALEHTKLDASQETNKYWYLFKGCDEFRKFPVEEPGYDEFRKFQVESVQRRDMENLW